MHRHTIGKIQVVIGVIFLIIAVGFSFYMFNHAMRSLEKIVASETGTWSDVKTTDYNSTRAHIISSFNVNSNVTLSSFYTIIFGALILSFLSVTMILQGLANMAHKGK